MTIKEIEEILDDYMPIEINHITGEVYFIGTLDKLKQSKLKLENYHIVQINPTTIWGSSALEIDIV